jgi:hypothetical protein
MQTLTPKSLREWLSFDDQTGFVWKRNRSRARAGARAGTLRDNGQRIIVLFGVHYTEQRLRYYWENGKLPSQRVRRKSKKGEVQTITCEPVVTGPVKECSRCGMSKSISGFYRRVNGSGNIGRVSECNTCHNERTRQNYSENRDYYVQQKRDYHAKKRVESLDLDSLSDIQICDLISNAITAEERAS